MTNKKKTSISFKVQELMGVLEDIASEDLKVRRKKSDKNDPMFKVLKASGELRDKIKSLENSKDETKNLLLKSNQILDSMLDHTPAAVAILDGPEFRYAKINQNVAELNGLSVEDHLGKPLKDVLLDAAENILPILRKIMKSGKAVLGREFSITLPKDPDNPVQLVDYLFPIPDEHGKPMCIGAIVLNITERKIAEEALKLSEKRYRLLIEQANDIIYTANLKGQFTFVNSVGQKLTGFSEKKVLSMHFNDLVHPDYREKTRKFYSDQIKNNIKNTYYEFPIVSSEEKTIWLGQNVQILSDNGYISGIQAVAREITDRKEMEIALQKAKDELEERVLERTRELNESNKEMIQSKVKLQETTNQLKVILDSQPLVTYMSKPVSDFGLTFVTNNVFELTGYRADEFLAKSSLWIDNVHPDDVEIAVENLSNLTDKEELDDYEYRYRRADGSYIWLNESMRLVKDNTFNNTHVVGMWEDITERKEAEIQLRKSRERLKTLMEKMPEGVVVAVDRNIVFGNRESTQIFGYKMNEFLNMPVIDFIHSEDRERAGKRIKEIMEGAEEAYSKYRMIKKDGSVFPAEVHSRKFEYEGKPALLSIIRDITESQRLSAELESTLSTLESIMDASYDGILVVNNEHKPVYYNDKFLDMWGLPRDTMPKMDFDDRIKSVRHLLKDPDGFKKRIQYFVENPEEEGYDVLELNNGIAYERHSTPHITDGKVVGRIWSFKDITDARIEELIRKEVEEKLRNAERMESLGILAGGVAHDLNNILGPIVAFPDLILLDLPEDTPVKNDLLDIRQAATDAAGIISDLLTLARRGKYNMEPLNLNEIVSSYLNSSSFKILKNNNEKIKFELDLADDIKNIKGSNAHLFKVIMNLVQNAFEAINRSGKVSIRSYRDRIEAQSLLYEELNDGEYVILKVVDSGGGVREEDISHIFEPFYSKKEMGKSGSGLGLSVVWSVVKDHGGFIDVETAVDEGTEFTLYFPVTGKTRKSRGKILETVRGDESILVVDDEARQRKVAERVLTSIGYDVSAAANGKEALKVLKSNDVNLVILDMVMENEDEGLEIFKKIKELNPTQKTIIVSGFSESVYVKVAKKLGVGKFIRKPYTKDILGNAVREELDR